MKYIKSAIQRSILPIAIALVASVVFIIAMLQA